MILKGEANPFKSRLITAKIEKLPKNSELKTRKPLPLLFPLSPSTLLKDGPKVKQRRERLPIGEIGLLPPLSYPWV